MCFVYKLNVTTMLWMFWVFWISPSGHSSGFWHVGLLLFFTTLLVQNNRKHPLPTPFAPKKMQTWTLTQEMEMPVPNSLSFKPHAAKLGQLTGLRFRCCVWPPPFPQCFPWQLKLKKKNSYYPFAPHQRNEQSSAPRHEGVLWKENDLIHFPM